MCKHLGKIPIHWSTGSGLYHLLAFCHLPAKWSKTFCLPEKRKILSLKQHQPHWWAWLSFLLAHSSCFCQNLLTSSHHFPVQPEQKRLFCLKTHAPLADKERIRRLRRATKTCRHICLCKRQLSVDFPTQLTFFSWLGKWQASLSGGKMFGPSLSLPLSLSLSLSLWPGNLSNF